MAELEVTSDRLWMGLIARCRTLAPMPELVMRIAQLYEREEADWEEFLAGRMGSAVDLDHVPANARDFWQICHFVLSLRSPTVTPTRAVIASVAIPLGDWRDQGRADGITSAEIAPWLTQRGFAIQNPATERSANNRAVWTPEDYRYVVAMRAELAANWAKLAETSGRMVTYYDIRVMGELAEMMTVRLGQPVSAGAVKGVLHRFRDTKPEDVAGDAPQMTGKQFQVVLRKFKTTKRMVAYQAIDAETGYVLTPETDPVLFGRGQAYLYRSELSQILDVADRRFPDKMRVTISFEPIED